jgi:hypothetical protein
MIKKLAYLILFIVIFVSVDTVLFGTATVEVLLVIAQIIYFVIVLYLLFSKSKIKSINWTLQLLLFLILLTQIVHQDYTLGYLIQINVLIAGYVISNYLGFRLFVDVFCKIMFYVAIVSIILFTVFIIFPFTLNYFSVNVNIKEVEYVNLFIYVHFVTMFRNTGIFREPGVFMIYLNVAIIFQLFVKNRSNKKYLIVFIIAILTTLSTAGFIVLLAIGILYLLKGKEKKKKFQGVLFLSIIIFVILNNYELFENTLNKFDSTSGDYSSSVARIASVQVPFAIFLDFPLFGTGLSQYGALYEKYSRELTGFTFKADSQSTNTFFNALATYGFFYFITLIYLFTKLTKLISQKKFPRIILFLIFAMMLSNEDLRYSLMFNILLFYGLSADQNTLNNIKYER